jgi:two-component system, chemotaxis family, sensor kinase Cph1
MTSNGSSELDLSACDREPIHIPGSIQPHGLLLAVDPGSRAVLQIAGTIDSLTGKSMADALDREVGHVLGPNAASLVTAALKMPMNEPQYLGTFRAPADTAKLLDLTAYMSGGVLILELEPTGTDEEAAAQILSRLRLAVAQLEAAPNLHALLQIAAEQVRLLTGFDRVMIYRFLEDGTGAVWAEAKVPVLPAFLNHHYPASDIPRQARALYLRNVIRVIPDVSYTPAPLAPVLYPLSGEPLDLGDSALRSVSPVHIRYLENMGVSASSSVSIIVDGELWGLIACHHRQPKLVPYTLRESLRHIGRFLSAEIRRQDEDRDQRQELSLTSAREALLAQAAKAESLEYHLLQQVHEIRATLPCEGAAILVGDELRQTGSVPQESEIRELAAWLLKRSPSHAYATHSLSKEYAPGAAYAAKASGLLSAIVARDAPMVILLFRAEQVEMVKWAGNPHKPAEPGDELGSLNPRKSFAAWSETVRGQSRTWTRAEKEAGRKLGEGLFDLLQRQKLGLLNLQLERTVQEKDALLEQKDLLVQEVHHRVQNSLQLVNSMLHLYAHQSGGAPERARFEEVSRRIMAISTVHEHLWRAKGIGHVEFGDYLQELRGGLIASWGELWSDQVTLTVPKLLVPTSTAVTLGLVLSELLTNAVKYAYEGGPGPIAVTVAKEGSGTIRITVRDWGVGIRGAPSGSGLGARLTQAFIAQLGGDVTVAAADPGTSVSLTTPLQDA